MQNVAPSLSLARRTRQLVVIAFIVVAIAVFILAVGIFLRIVPFAAPDNNVTQMQQLFSTTMLVVGGLLVLIGLGVAVRALTRRRENDLALITGDTLQLNLDERYTFIRNINRPRLGYIDAVLVGPPGVLVYRILNSDGEWLNEKGGWVRRNRSGGWSPAPVNPTKEAVVDVKAVRDYLGSKGLEDLDVYGVVVFINEPPQMVFQAENPVVPVSHLSGLIDALKTNYLARERMAPRVVDRVVNLLLGEA